MNTLSEDTLRLLWKGLRPYLAVALHSSLEALSVLSLDLLSKFPDCFFIPDFKAHGCEPRGSLQGPTLIRVPPGVYAPDDVQDRSVLHAPVMSEKLGRQPATISFSISATAADDS